MKKLVSILVTLAIILCLSVTAFAAENTTLTIEDSAGRTYVGYHLLELTTSLKDPDAGVDHTHVAECYNYGYKFTRDEQDDSLIVSPYFPILQKEVFNSSSDTFWDALKEAKPSSETAITEDHILAYLESQSGDSTDGYHTMRQVADRVYRAIIEAGITPEVSPLNAAGADITQGYWLIADVTENLNGNEAHSLVMIATKGQDNVTIQSKTALPTLEKRVKNIENSEDSDISDNIWTVVADHDINDTIPFKLTGTLPSNAQYYTSYKMVFHDTLSSALTLKEGSIKVLMYNSKHRADGDTDLNNFDKDVTDFFTASNVQNGAFSVGCDNLFEIEGVTKDTAFVVFYEATLGENAVIGGAGNPNEAYLEFSNNPYGTGTGNTAPSKVVIFTYQMVVNKVDANGNPLAGAGFRLSKKNPDMTYTVVKEFLAGEATTFTWTGLDDGDYLLEETTVPAGYNGMADIRFTISATFDNDALTLTSLDGGVMGTGVVEIGEIAKNIVNNTGAVLPETGAEGTFFLITGGTLLVLVAAVFMITRKKMSIYED